MNIYALGKALEDERFNAVVEMAREFRKKMEILA